MSRSGLRSLILWLLSAALYTLTARLGLLFALPPGFASPIWPPAGLSLGVVLVFGPRAWPGVLLGSWFANAIRPEGLILDYVPVLVAIGSTAQALLGRAFVIRLCGRDAGLDSPANVFGFIAATVASCLTSASVGVFALTISGKLLISEVPANWAPANAFAADREACEAAGMDGFLAKPLTLETLQAELRDVPMGTGTEETHQPC